MAITAVEYAYGHNVGALQSEVTRLIAAGFSPSGSPSALPNGYLQLMVQGTADGTFEDLAARVGALETWSGTLATKLNADATAQNALAAFPLTLDTDYAGAV